MAAVVRMPEVATGAGEAGVQDWLVDVGTEVTAGQPIVEIETEKAVVEFEAGEAGVLAGILLPAGESAAVGTPIAVIATGGESIDEALAGFSPSQSDTAAPPSTDPSEGTDPPEGADPGEGAAPSPPASSDEAAAADPPPRVFATPLVRRLARERGLDLARISGSGPHGRIVRRDLDALAPSGAASPAPDRAEPGTGETVRRDPAFTEIEHGGMRRAIARRLSESQGTVPHFYLVADCHVDELLDLRRRINEHADHPVSVNDLVIKAVAHALREVPEANASWTDEAIRRFAGVDIAVAVSVPSGLLTPVVRGVEELSIGALSATVRDLADRARSGRLRQHELEGGSFSVSNLGMYGIREFTAIINPPHAGILAVGAAAPRPVVAPDGSLAVATVMTVTLSADHRVLDGAVAARWLTAFQKYIESPVSILV